LDCKVDEMPAVPLSVYSWPLAKLWPWQVQPSMEGAAALRLWLAGCCMIDTLLVVSCIVAPVPGSSCTITGDALLPGNVLNLITVNGARA
jgi:hypothetical protein